MKKTSFNKLSKKDQDLLMSASDAMLKAYNPYSNFFVGAAILSFDNKIISASNFENVSYGATICAERSALVSANAQGIRKIKKIAIISKNSKKPISPCGICRQMIFESSQLSNFDIEVIMSNNKMDKIIIAKISELLPLAFF